MICTSVPHIPNPPTPKYHLQSFLWNENGVSDVELLMTDPAMTTAGLRRVHRTRNSRRARLCWVSSSKGRYKSKSSALTFVSKLLLQISFRHDLLQAMLTVCEDETLTSFLKVLAQSSNIFNIFCNFFWRYSLRHAKIPKYYQILIAETSIFSIFLCNIFYMYLLRHAKSLPNIIKYYLLRHASF